MKRRTRSILLATLLVLSLFLCGCEGGFHGDTTAVTEKGSSLEDKAFWETFFDKGVSHHPSEEEMARIREGMAFYEVIEILGKPHRHLRELSSGGSYEWELSSGKVYTIGFRASSRPEGWQSMSAEEWFSHMTADGAPRVVDFVSFTEAQGYAPASDRPRSLASVTHEAFRQRFALLALDPVFSPDCVRYQYFLDDPEAPRIGLVSFFDGEGRGFHAYVAEDAFVPEYDFSAEEGERSVLFFEEYELYRLSDPVLESVIYAKLEHSGWKISLSTFGLTEQQTLALVKNFLMRMAEP